MTKAEFLKALEEKLSALSAEDRAASLAYYEEIIDDRMEEGLCEADAVAAAGPVEEAAAQLLAETPHAETRLCAQPKRIEPAGSFLLFTDPFDAVEIHAACADVELWPSEDGVCRVEFQEEQRCAASVAGGILRIQELRRHRVGLTLDLSIGGRQLLDVPMLDNALRVYLPARTYRMLRAETRSGEIEVSDGLSFDRAALRSASGDVEFRAAVQSELRIHTASGDIEVKHSAPERMHLDTGYNGTYVTGDTYDREITSAVQGYEQPTENDQSNFGTGYKYRYGKREGTIEIEMNSLCRIFATEAVRQQIQFPNQ